MADGGAADDRSDDELGAAVDGALEPELKRQRARFMQAIVGLDRGEGVGRSEAHREHRLDLGRDRRDDRAD